MLGTLRTYRLIRVFVAAVLLFGVSLPLVRHACAMTGTSVAAPAAVEAPKLCPEANVQQSPCPERAEAFDRASCCQEELVPVKAPTLGPEPISFRLILPLYALPADAAPAPARPDAPSPVHLPTAADGGGVPLRVLHASFLL